MSVLHLSSNKHSVKHMNAGDVSSKGASSKKSAKGLDKRAKILIVLSLIGIVICTCIVIAAIDSVITTNPWLISGSQNSVTAVAISEESAQTPEAQPPIIESAFQGAAPFNEQALSDQMNLAAPMLFASVFTGNLLSGKTTFSKNADGSTEPQVDPNDPRLQTSDSKNTTKPNERVVYLTFDDGPSDLTPKILSILEKNGVKATWFVAGQHSNLDMLPQIWNDGHQVAIHTDTHNYKKIYKSKKAFFKDMDAVAKKIEKRLGFTPTLLRFPGGSINSYDSKVLKSIKAELKKRGWHYFDWNASDDDAVSTKARSAKKILASVKKSSKGKDSVCLLMHDTNAKKTTVKALDKIIKYYKNKGYKFEYLTSDSYGYHF